MKKIRRTQADTRLAQFRIAKGIEQQDLGEMLGLPNGTLSHFENNVRPMKLNPEQYWQYLTILDITPKQLKDAWVEMQKKSE